MTKRATHTDTHTHCWKGSNAAARWEEDVSEKSWRVREAEMETVTMLRVGWGGVELQCLFYFFKEMFSRVEDGGFREQVEHMYF